MRAASQGWSVPVKGDVESESLCILVVDDNADTLDLLGLLLRRRGHTVHTAASAARALQHVAALHPDLVFLDLAIPDMDGFEIAKQVRRQPKFTETKIVAITGYDDAAHRQRARYAGFDAYLVKPVAVAQIDAAVNAVREALLRTGHEAHPNC